MRGPRALLGAFLLLLLMAVPARAQNDARVTGLTVSLQPQFDDPRLLLVLEATLDRPGSALIAIPPAVELHGASYADESGALQPLAASFEATSEGRYIRVDSPTREARLALYQDVIPSGPERVVLFTLPPQRYELETLRWTATFPGDATGIATEPAMEAVGNNHFGLPQFQRVAGPLAARESATQRIAWVRASDEPVFALAAAPDSDPLPAPAPSRSRTNLVLAALFVLGLGLVMHGLWQSRRARA